MKLFKSGEAWMFDATAEFYAWMTWQEVWRTHCGRTVEYFPAEVGPTPRVLDLGIGPGVSGIAIKDRLPGAKLVGLDYSRRMLKVAERYVARAGVEIDLVWGDVAALPFEDGSFDVVTGHSFLYLLPDRRAALAEIARVLRPGGGCVFLEPHEGGAHAAWMRMSGRKRFKLSMALWRAVSGRIGRFRADELAALLGTTLAEVEVESALGGLGLVGRARRR